MECRHYFFSIFQVLGDGHLKFHSYLVFVFFFFQAEDGIRDIGVTGVQTCALPISRCRSRAPRIPWHAKAPPAARLPSFRRAPSRYARRGKENARRVDWPARVEPREIGRASCRERV